MPRNISVRLQVARALAARPRLVVIDRALDGLDPVDRQVLVPLLLPAKRSWSCLVASNDPSTLALMDRIVRMEAGGVVVAGSAPEVLATDPWCRQLAGRAV